MRKSNREAGADRIVRLRNSNVAQNSALVWSTAIWRSRQTRTSLSSNIWWLLIVDQGGRDLGRVPWTPSMTPSFAGWSASSTNCTTDWTSRSGSQRN